MTATECPGAVMSSPRTRGCFRRRTRRTRLREVFPAHAGVFQWGDQLHGSLEGLPRARGGVSFGQVRATCAVLSSPRTRGCFRDAGTLVTVGTVFPAHAGVFPSRPSSMPVWRCLPRARGGVSVPHRVATSSGTSSPRTRGCFHDYTRRHVSRHVFPAHAGVFPRLHAASCVSPRLPRARGGVSCRCGSGRLHRRSSPRTRGCFHELLDAVVTIVVFPAHAGVFPFTSGDSLTPLGLPRARGGVSLPLSIRLAEQGSSPRTRGCFPDRMDRNRGVPVFPAHAGVFPCVRTTPPSDLGLPRARGGVSAKPLPVGFA